MKRFWKIFLIAGLILILIIGAIGYITYVQAKRLILLSEDKNLKVDMAGLMIGQCEKLPNVESKLIEIKAALKSGCKNPIIKIIVSKYSPEQDLCNLPEMESKLNEPLEKIRTYCSNQ